MAAPRAGLVPDFPQFNPIVEMCDDGIDGVGCEAIHVGIVTVAAGVFMVVSVPRTLAARPGRVINQAVDLQTGGDGIVDGLVVIAEHRAVPVGVAVDQTELDPQPADTISSVGRCDAGSQVDAAVVADHPAAIHTNWPSAFSGEKHSQGK